MSETTRPKPTRMTVCDLEQFRQRRYDFHAECILRLVETAVAERTDTEAAR